MKYSYFFSSAICLFCLVISGCREEFLDLKPIASVNSENFFSTEEDALQAVNACYAAMRSALPSLILLTEVRSDNSLAHYDPGNRGGGNQEREELDEFRDLSSNPDVQSFWSTAYNGLYRINTVLARIESMEMNPDLKARLMAEVKFMRAFFYFNLVQLFGDVPLILTPITDVASAYTVGRTASSQVYEQIIQDAEDALSVLPAVYDNSKNNEKGRITRGAVLTLLGKVHLTLKQYSSAQPYLEEVTTLGYGLEPVFENVFKNNNSTEGILEMQYSTAAGQGFTAINNWVPRGSGKDSPWDKITGGLPGGVAFSWNIPSNTLMAAFEEGDLRKNVTFKIAEDAIVGAVPERQDIQYVNKWIPYLGNTNFKIYRYADVLLMLSEIYTESGDLGRAANNLNLVRARAGLPDTKADSQESLRLAIEQERQRELAFEGHRWFDLLRTERAIEVMTKHGLEERVNPSIYRDTPYSSVSYTIQPFRLLYPVPLTEILKNSAVLTQNPGY